jgi:hypothetical protein
MSWFFNMCDTPTCFGLSYSTILRGPYAVLCAVTILSSADLLSLSIYIVCGCMCISSIDMDMSNAWRVSKI